MSTKTATNYLAEKIDWKKTTDPHYPFSAEFEDEKCVLRLNDFPENNLFTLVVNRKEVANFDDWPAKWNRPAEKKIRKPASKKTVPRPLLAIREPRAVKS